MGEKIVEARDIGHAYVRGRATLRGVSLGISRGELVAIVGENGSGKTTLARHLNALIPLQEGELSVTGIDAGDPSRVWELRRACGMVFQNPENQFVSSVVGEDVAFGPLNFGADEPEAREAASAALSAVGLAGFERRDTHALSGGQQQRVALAGVLACDADVIVLDEATSMVDPRGRDELVRAVARARDERGTTVIWITHDMELAARSRASRAPAPRARRPTQTSRSTVDSKNWRSGIWNTSPTDAARRRAPGPRRASAPSTRRRPESGGSTPARTSSRVDLPEPVWPMSPVTPPSSESVTSSSARFLSPAAPS